MFFNNIRIQIRRKIMDNDKRMYKFEVKRSNLETSIGKEVDRTKETTIAIQSKIQLLESELAIQDHEENEDRDNSSMQFLLDELIKKNEKEL